MRAARLSRWLSAVASSCEPLARTILPIKRSPLNLAVTGIPSANGVNASRPRDSKACKTPLAPVGPGAFPPSERIAVLSIATSKTEDHARPVNGWTLEEIAKTIVNEAHAASTRRATVQRILAGADLKPHKSVYWLNSHDPDFEAIAKEVCGLYVKAPAFYQIGRASCRERVCYPV